MLLKACLLQMLSPLSLSALTAFRSFSRNLFLSITLVTDCGYPLIAEQTVSDSFLRKQTKKPDFNALLS